MKKPRLIVLADDDLDDQELLEEALLEVDENANIHTVTGGNHLLQFLGNCHDDDLPCLIIIDYNMPDLNGVEVLEQMSTCERYQSIPIIVWSTSGLQLYKDACESKGAKAYFNKPHNFSEIKQLAGLMLEYCE